ncbi:non-classical arabinogalactan protein 31-like [Lycium barbarum]|uniref:non-classical arabinogalactan protein 31-like n=1 Tax=Lycium barbarum TaxID=112863 RepID=UPI00293E6E6A|nr:non-classical arabinogalactan protein 31-like [Lycium barbarum]
MAKALVLFKLSVLLLSSFTTVLSHGDHWYSLDKNVDHLSPAQAPKPHHHHPKHSPTPSPTYTPSKPPAKCPTPPPAKPPTPPAYSPSKPPAKPPVKPPTPSVKPPTPSPYYPTRKPVAVRGLVYCKSCKYRGVNTLNQATPLLGAVVKLVCNNTKKPLVEQGKTDKNGFFWIMPKLLTSGAYHKCKVFLVSSNNSYCDVPTNYNGGISGALLKYTPFPKNPVPVKPKFDVFTVGPFGFEPSKKVPCKKLHYEIYN